MNVGAEDKGTGKKNSVTITNSDRLTEDQIQDMLDRAQEFEEEDKKIKEQIDAKNALDGYIASMSSTLEGDEVKSKLDEEEVEKLKEAIEEARSWMNDNTDADVDDIKEKQKELESIAGPIIGKIYGGGQGGAAEEDDDEDDHDEL